MGDRWVKVGSRGMLPCLWRPRKLCSLPPPDSSQTPFGKGASATLLVTKNVRDLEKDTVNQLSILNGKAQVRETVAEDPRPREVV